MHDYKNLMKKAFIFIFFLLVCTSLFAQISPVKNQKDSEGLEESGDLVPARNFSKTKVKKDKPPIDLYRIISADRDTTYVDTTLTLQKEYKFNYLRKDNFELLPFSNVGQTYNRLGYDFDATNLKPLFVAQSHHYNYLDVEDMYYYHVPTPLTELYYKTAFSQGQQLDAFFTVNTSEQFNFSIAYKGVRSLGNYQNILTSTGNFRFTTNYHTKNKRYNIRAHFTQQDIINEENGGLRDSSIPLFVNDDNEFEDRGRLEVNFEDARNIVNGVRVYLEHEYELISQRDSIGYNVLTLGNSFTFEDKYYRFQQDQASPLLGDAYKQTNLRKRSDFQETNTKVYARFDNSLLGSFSAFLNYNDFFYAYNSVVILDDGSRINNRIFGNQVQFGGSYKKQYKGFELSGKGAINIAGEFDGNYLGGAASFAFNDDLKAEASINVHSVAPNFNFLLNQSDYINYNWENNFENVKTQQLKFEVFSKKYANASVTYTGIDDYTYFDLKPNDSTPLPIQANARVDYLKLKANKEFRYGKFGLDNTFMYQNVVSGEQVLNVPQLTTRNTIYFEDKLFKNALFVQTGITYKWFSKYNMNGYDPVLAEFYVQNDQELGSFSLFDIYLNMKVRQTRIFFKYEHVNSLFSTQNNYFSAPGYPYRDATIRFGLVWDFFL